MWLADFEALMQELIDSVYKHSTSPVASEERLVGTYLQVHPTKEAKAGQAITMCRLYMCHLHRDSALSLQHACIQSSWSLTQT